MLKTFFVLAASIMLAGCSMNSTNQSVVNTVTDTLTHITTNAVTNTMPADIKIWLAYFPTQCNTVPWEKDYSTATIQEYYQAQYNVTIYAVDDTAAPDGYISCSACGCPTGQIVKVQIAASDKETMLGLGFDERLTVETTTDSTSVTNTVANTNTDPETTATAVADAADIDLQTRAETVQRTLANYYHEHKSYPDDLATLQLTVDTSGMNYTPIGSTPADYYDLRVELSTGSTTLNP